MASQLLAVQMIPRLGVPGLAAVPLDNPGAMPLRRASAPEDLVSPEGIVGDTWHEVY